MPTVRIAAMSDVHVSKTSHGTLAPILAQVADRARRGARPWRRRARSRSTSA
jgi:hypothetical protein